MSAPDAAPPRHPHCCRRLLGSVDGESGPARSCASVHLKDAAMNADGRQPHVLIINDTQEILDLMRELLEDEGYRVTTSLEPVMHLVRFGHGKSSSAPQAVPDGRE